MLNQGQNIHSARVMGVLNVTPDSFSDGGRYRGVAPAVERAHEMVSEGASLIDVGGESTRPGASPVSEAQEKDRVIPVIRELCASRLSVPVSIDTSKPDVMSAAIEAGAGFVNDVNALQAPGALDVVSAADVPVCLMHKQGKPATMQQSPRYGDVVSDVRDFLGKRIDCCLNAGIRESNILVDPGIGFGKTLEHNLQIIRSLSCLCDDGFPVLLGVSRKSMIGDILGKPVTERLMGGIALAVLAVSQGVQWIRTHDVGATAEALDICRSVLGESLPEPCRETVDESGDVI